MNESKTYVTAIFIVVYAVLLVRREIINAREKKKWEEWEAERRDLLRRITNLETKQKRA